MLEAPARPHGSRRHSPPKPSRRTGWRCCVTSRSARTATTHWSRVPRPISRERASRPRRGHTLCATPGARRPTPDVPGSRPGSRPCGVAVPPARRADGSATAVAARAGAGRGRVVPRPHGTSGWRRRTGSLPSREATYTGRRYICCGRDLATWTRTDYPGQAGVQAALLLEALRAPVTPQHPYVRSRNQAGYVTFGLPFIVDLASRVAMHALRASWFQKWVRASPAAARGARRATRGRRPQARRSWRGRTRASSSRRRLPRCDAAPAPVCCRWPGRRARRCIRPIPRRMRRRPARWSRCSRRTTPRNG